jgi:hypothetical protein
MAPELFCDIQYESLVADPEIAIDWLGRRLGQRRRPDATALPSSFPQRSTQAIQPEMMARLHSYATTDD